MLNSNRNKLILIVDDVSKNLQVLATILYQEGYEIAVAENGKSALAILKNIKPDLILLDIMMPEMDGYEVCSIIKSNPEIATIPIIFLTAKNDTESVVKSFELGASDYLTKPFNAMELKARVKTHLSLRENSQKLENLNNILEDKVNERTLQLKKANERLGQLDNAKNYFLGLLSHELNTPLTQIKSSCSLLKAGNLDADTEELIDFIISSTDWLEKFTKLSTLITSLKAEKYEMNIESIKLVSLIDEVIFRLQSDIQSKKINLITEYFNEDIDVKIDSYLFHQCLYFLLDNSIKYSSNNASITVKSVINDGDFLIQFLDDGTGFSNDYLTNQFELFTSDNLMSHQKGMGLSLTAAKLIIESHGGKLLLSNKIDKGACVTLSIPIS